jgi:hypothetical protein
VTDLDGDGDTTEPLPVDLDGSERVQGVDVDMGAYEGASEAQDASASVEDFDQGEIAVLVPDGGVFDPMSAAAAFVINVSGPDNAFFGVTRTYQDRHPGAGGRAELDQILFSESTLSDGEFKDTMFINFTAADLQGHAPLTIDLTIFDPVLQHWVLAASFNTQNSPGHGGPLGDRIAVESTGDDYQVSTELGDYGVFWNPAEERGFAWAVVDVIGDFAIGAPRCPGDCGPAGGDGVVSTADVLAFIAGWDSPGACDFDASGTVDEADILTILGSWGPCAEPLGAGGSAAPGKERRRGSSVALRSSDLDGDGRTDRRDLERLKAAWGPCGPGCRADLDRDGRVGTSDLLALLAGWTQS